MHNGEFHITVSVTSAQIRGARGLLGWTVRDLAEKSNVHRNTVTNFETGRHSGDPWKLRAMIDAIEAAGVEFIAENGGGPGVRLQRSKK